MKNIEILSLTKEQAKVESKGSIQKFVFKCSNDCTQEMIVKL